MRVDRLVRLDHGEMHVVADGDPRAPAVLLIHGALASTGYWDLVVPWLADAFHVVRVDLLGHGRSTSPAGGYDIATQARRVGAAMDELGVRRATVIGHSTGATVATALAEQRPDAVAALALIDMGPDLDAKIPERPLVRLLMVPLVGSLLWRLRTEGTVRKAARTGFARPVDLRPDLVDCLLGMTHRAFVGTMRATPHYLAQRSLPDRLGPLGLPVLVIFGADDQRWHSASAAGYRVLPGARIELLPGIGHTPILEDPATTGSLLLDFARSH